MHDEAPDLPAPVGRFLSRAMPGGPRRIASLTMFQQGRLRTDQKSPRWTTFHAVHSVFPEEVRFHWSARVRVLPFFALRVRDRLEEGRGSVEVSAGPLRLSRSFDSPAMNAGSLHRFLAEAVWYPPALLPSQQLSWAALDDRRALATLTNRGTTVSLEFRFTEDGDVASVFTPARWGRFEGEYREAGWEGRFADRVERDGLRVPTYGEVGWWLEDSWATVWEGRVTSARYVFEAP